MWYLFQIVVMGAAIALFVFNDRPPDRLTAALTAFWWAFLATLLLSAIIDLFRRLTYALRRRIQDRPTDKFLGPARLTPIVKRHDLIAKIRLPRLTKH
jgi:hypothetical protein